MLEHQLFFENFIHQKAHLFKALPQSGSSRINYIGKTEAETYIVTFNENIRENRAFFYFSNIFSSLNLNTPKVIKINNEEHLYIQEYLGGQTLSELITKEKESNRVCKLVKKTIDKLYEIQVKTLGKIDYKNSFEYEAYNHLPIRHDLYYFKNFLVDVLELEYHKSTLLKEFEEICTQIENLGPKTIMMRDFQSRNIMIDEKDNIFFIDYQSAMEGPATYDLVSFLHQAKANFSFRLKEEMTNYYISLWPEINRTALKNTIDWMKLIRFTQVLGAYGFRGLIQRKTHFLASLDQGIKNLTDLMSQSKLFENKFPELTRIVEQLNSERIKEKIESLK